MVIGIKRYHTQNLQNASRENTKKSTTITATLLASTLLTGSAALAADVILKIESWRNGELFASCEIFATLETIKADGTYIPMSMGTTANGKRRQWAITTSARTIAKAKKAAWR